MVTDVDVAPEVGSGGVFGDVDRIREISDLSERPKAVVGRRCGFRSSWGTGVNVCRPRVDVVVVWRSRVAMARRVLRTLPSVVLETGLGSVLQYD